jgi:hypothetical protein
MLRFRWVALAAILLVALVLATRPVQAQPEPTGSPLSYQGLLYLGDPALHKELKLSEDQVAGLGRLREQWREAIKDYRDWKDDELGKKMVAANKAIARFLTPAQAERFEQVLLQQLRVLGRVGSPGGRAGPVAVLGSPLPFGRAGRTAGVQAVLLYAPSAEKLALADGQKEKIAALYTETARIEQMIQTELGRSRPNEPAADNYAGTLEAFRKAADRKFRAVLTDKQRQQLDKMIGEPFKGKFSGRGRFGRFGGPPF